MVTMSRKPLDKNQQLFLGFVEGLVDYAPKDLDEGFGTFYERYMMNRYFKKLIITRKIKTIFEGPSDGITGIRGINSFPMVESGCSLIYYTPSAREKRLVEKTWKRIQQEVGSRMDVQVRSGPPLDFPFKDDSFDLVWNFCVMEHFYNPLSVLKEMTRISSKYILVMIQNVWNIGTLPHIFYHKLTRKLWDHGNTKWMSTKGMESLIEKLNLKIVEKGMIDIPIWPDTWDVPIRGVFKGALSTRGGGWNWSTLNDVSMERQYPLIRYTSVIEHSHLPKPIKLLWVHHLYALCRKSTKTLSTGYTD